MNKTELIAAIAEAANITKTQAGAALNAFIEITSDTLAKREKITLIGFGVFETRERAARVGHNPQTHEEVQIPACTVPAFKPSKNLKEKVNEAKAKKSKKK